MSAVETITIPRAEYEALKKLQEELPAMLQKARDEGGMDRLKMLNQRYKDNPELNRANAKRNYALKRDTILAKRREQYRLKKEAELAAKAAAENPGASV